MKKILYILIFTLIYSVNSYAFYDYDRIKVVVNENEGIYGKLEWNYSIKYDSWSAYTADDESKIRVGKKSSSISTILKKNSLASDSFKTQCLKFGEISTYSFDDENMKKIKSTYWRATEISDRAKTIINDVIFEISTTYFGSSRLFSCTAEPRKNKYY